ncbi:MAG: hypothetical protein HY319_01325 [Armatimonadetes bacterium]|nr:hypothetical protein [Armatimonadota bacterium]
MDAPVPLPPELVRGLRDLETRLGKPIRLRLVRLEDGGEPHCRLRERSFCYELMCHDPMPGYFWHLDAVRRFLEEALSP